MLDRAQRCNALITELFEAEAAKRVLDMKIIALRQRIISALAFPENSALKSGNHHSTGHMNAAARILQNHNGPMTSAELANSAGFSRVQAGGCLGHLVKHGLAKRLDDGSYLYVANGS